MKVLSQISVQGKSLERYARLHIAILDTNKKASGRELVQSMGKQTLVRHAALVQKQYGKPVGFRGVDNLLHDCVKIRWLQV